jgi:microcystin-dependent protein
MTDEGWKPADGSLISRKKNPILYSIISTLYCDEDLRCCNAELFALPDLIRVPGRKA